MPPSGLTSDEGRRRLAKFGRNAMPDATPHPLRMALEKFWAAAGFAVVLDMVKVPAFRRLGIV